MAEETHATPAPTASHQVLAGEPVPVTDLPGVYKLLTELGVVVTGGYRCLLYAWEDYRGKWSWRPQSGASLGEGVDLGRAAKSLISEAGASSNAGLYRLDSSPTRSMVKYDIEAVAVFPFAVRFGQAGEKRFVLYLDVLRGEVLDEARVERLGKVLSGLLSLGGGAISALLAVEDDVAARSQADRSFRGDYSAIVGRSAPIRRVLDLVDRIAPTDFPVLVQGDTGTGKELVARALHGNGKRGDGPFEAINCAMLPEKLAESMLFGHRRGAFTDAKDDHRGVFEVASGGTLFLDEIGELVPDHQAKLLRALEDGTIRPIGAEADLSVDVRVVSATNRDLRELVERGSFRADLFHRISSVTIELPTLAERREDIPELVRHFLAPAGKRIAPEALARLTAAPWEGNVRELEAKVRVLSELTVGDEIGLAEIDFLRLPGASVEPPSWSDAWHRTERDFLVRVITESEPDSVEGVAKLLGKSRSWLYEKAKEHGIRVADLLQDKASARASGPSGDPS